MNREIRFRFWLGGTNKMTYEHDLREVGQIIPEFSDDIIPLQFTGLKDKNGTEIYEGDFIRDNPTRYWLVIWDEYRAGFYYQLCAPKKISFHGRIGPLTTKVQKYLMDEMEVIGNIYQNKNLIEP